VDVFDEKEDVVAQIKNNEFILNPQNAFNIESDKSHLAITIVRRKQEVFRMTYLNPNAIKIEAALHYPGSKESVLVTDDEVSLGTIPIMEPASIMGIVRSMNLPLTR